MPTNHLIQKLKKAAVDATIFVKRGRVIRTKVNGKTVEAVATYQKTGGEHWIEVALRAHKTPGELVHSVIHELLHYIGYNEEAVSSGLDDEAFKSRVLREVVALRLVGILGQFAGNTLSTVSESPQGEEQTRE